MTSLSSLVSPATSGPAAARYRSVMDDAVVRQHLRNLLQAWDDAPDSASLGQREHMLVGLCVFGFTAHTYRLVAALLALEECGMLGVGTPLVRQAMECAITALWIERGGHAEVLTLIREQTRQQRNAVDELIRAGASDDATIRDRLDDDLAGQLASATGAGEKFFERCKELQGAEQFYALYRAASRTSHASTDVVDLYMDASDNVRAADGHLALSLVPRANTADGWLGALLPLVVVATAAWSRVERSHAARTATKALASELHIAWRPEYSAYGLGQRRKRERELKAWLRTQRAAGTL